MTIHKAFAEATALLFCFAGAFVIIYFGIYLSFFYNDSHWMNRCGAAVVCLESVVAFVEFRRTKRLEKIKHKYNMLKEFEYEAEQAEYKVLLAAVILALSGEILHGFGDLILESIVIVGQH